MGGDQKQRGTRWLTCYTISVCALGSTAIGLGAALAFAPALGEPPEAAVLFVLGIFYIGVAVGLNGRRLWAWRMNYWGLLLVQPITVAGYFGFWDVQRFKILVSWRGELAVLLGLWSALNMLYFRRRRHLFHASVSPGH